MRRTLAVCTAALLGFTPLALTTPAAAAEPVVTITAPAEGARTVEAGTDVALSATVIDTPEEGVIPVVEEVSWTYNSVGEDLPRRIATPKFEGDAANWTATATWAVPGTLAPGAYVVKAITSTDGSEQRGSEEITVNVTRPSPQNVKASLINETTAAVTWDAAAGAPTGYVVRVNGRDLVAGGDFERIAGPNRYYTAVEVSQANFPESAETVFVASGENFPDALAAGPLAARNNAPLLLVPSSQPIPAQVTAELRRLSPSQIIVMGGPSAVSAGIEAELSGIAPVTRYGGADRYATAALAALGEGAPNERVFLATGLNFPDSLVAGAVAGEVDGTVLLTAPGSLPSVTADALGQLSPSEVVIAGGTDVVSDAVQAQVRAAVGAVPVTRAAGADRYGTSAALSRLAFPADTSEVYLATGLNYPDALAGAAVAGPNNAALLLTDPNCVPQPTLTEIGRFGTPQITVLGGPASVSDRAASLTPC